MIYILFAIGACVALFLVVVAMRPPAFRIERSIVIATPPEKPFDHVNDLKAWEAWSPFEKFDANLKRTYEGPAAGTGASYAWSGNKKAGEGKMTIERSDRPNVISFRLLFTRPFSANNMVTFSFVPVDGGTKVTWAMEGKNNFIAKAFCMCINMDKMVGSEFAEGLASLKRMSESA